MDGRNSIVCGSGSSSDPTNLWDVRQKVNEGVRSVLTLPKSQHQCSLEKEGKSRTATSDQVACKPSFRCAGSEINRGKIIIYDMHTYVSVSWLFSFVIPKVHHKWKGLQKITSIVSFWYNEFAKSFSFNRTMILAKTYRMIFLILSNRQMTGCQRSF